jgi:hypothetical protein
MHGELLLDNRDRHAFHHQLVCVGMTQAMRMNALLDACSSGVFRFEPTADNRHRTWVETDDTSVPWRTVSVPTVGSKSLGLSARVSPARRPPRDIATMSARFLIPVGAVAAVVISLAVSSEPLQAANNRTAASSTAVTIRVFPIRIGRDIVLLLVG